ncbi:MAG: translocation/assembly module TamB domain-containing protein [Pseudomonadota bacterium]
MAEEQVIDAAPHDAPVEAPERKRKRRWAKRLGWAIAIVFVPIMLAFAFIASPIGKRFIADQIAQVAPASGMRFEVGRIEGDVLNEARLYDVTVLDPQGAFLTIPEATLDWRPLAWLWSGLDIREVTASRATLKRLPELLPGDPDAPLLPDFDIRVDTLAIENLTLAAGVAGEAAQRVDLTGTVDVRSGRALIDAKGRFGPEDRLDLLLDAEPDGDRFDLALDYNAAADGPIAALAGLDAAYRGQIEGEGTWTRWVGYGLVTRQRGEDPPARIAAFQVTNDAGRYGVLGEAEVLPAGDTIIGRAAGGPLALALTGTLEDSVFDGRLAAITSALDLRGEGVIDLADNVFDGFDASAVLRDPDWLGSTARLEDARLDATLTGKFSDLSIEHRLTVGELDTGVARLEGLVQSANASFAGGRLALPLDTKVERVITGQDVVDPRLQGGTMRGRLTYRAGALSADNTRITFPGLTAIMTLRGDVNAGGYALAGPIRASGVAVPEIGTVDGEAKILAKFGNVPWTLNANLAGRLVSLTNESIATIAGEPVAFRGRLGLGANQPIVLRDASLESDVLTAQFDSRLVGDRTSVVGEGRHAEYGPFTVDAQLEGGDVRAQLVLADPLPAAGLKDVRVAIAPSVDGFALDVNGQSLLGEFAGALGLVLPSQGPTRIDVDQLRVYRTNVTGALAFAEAGLSGSLALNGGGLDGTISIAPATQGTTGFDLDLAARNARFGGATEIALARADIDASGRFGGEQPTQVSADIAGSGLVYGALSIARFAAKADISDGAGDVTASIAGRRADRFALKLDGDIAPERISLLARGEYGGRRITMPRRAVLSALEGGGYRLAPAQIGYGRGYAVLEGELGGADTRISASLARMPLRLADLAGAELGLSGRLSGTASFQQSGNGPPIGKARLKIDDFARSGLVLSSRPVDLLAGLDLTGTSLRAAAQFDSDEAQLGRLDARITGIAGGGALTDRIMRGALSARFAFEGPAQSLWRLAAIETFDLTGPLTVSARATGTLNDPSITGQLASDDLRLQSAVSGTDVRDVSARGRFAGSRLELTRFAGKTDGGGTVNGSGTIDLGAMSAQRGPRIDLRAAVNDARLLNAAGLDATLTGPLRIVSDGVGGTIAGRVEIDKASWKLGYAAEDMRLAQIKTLEINRKDELGTEASSAAAGSWRYLIDASAPSRVSVDGLGLDSEWGIDIALRGTVSDPRIGGEANLVRGAYSFAGTRFELTRGDIRFDVNRPIDPRLDIAAETDTGDYNVTIAIQGNSQAPEITFSSEPQLPEEEILAQLLFGGSVTSLSATDAVQLGAALASLRGGGGGLDPIGQLRQSIGLDQLRIVSADPAIGRSTGVALGKNLGRKFYVEIVTDGRGYSATQVEYQVTRWLALLGTVTTIGRDRVGVEIRRDY